MRHPDQSNRLLDLLDAYNVQKAVISAVTLYELEMGVIGRRGEKEARASLTQLLSGPVCLMPLSDNAARCAARLNASARARGQELSSLDGLIAGHAMELGATLVTDDARLAMAVGEVDVVRWR
jgi:tRNA(fMet)-specific endonuclease VapC